SRRCTRPPPPPALPAARGWPRRSQTLGIEGISKSQVSRMAAELDAEVTAVRSRTLDGGPSTYVSVDALIQKVREGGRIVNVAVVIALGINAQGHRGGPGLRRDHHRRRRRLAGVPTGTGGPEAGRDHPGDLRRPPRPGRRGPLDPGRGDV